MIIEEEEEEEEAPLEKRREWGVTRIPESNLLFPEKKETKKQYRKYGKDMSVVGQ